VFDHSVGGGVVSCQVQSGCDGSSGKTTVRLRAYNAIVSFCIWKRVSCGKLTRGGGCLDISVQGEAIERRTNGAGERAGRVEANATGRRGTD
jgi:hypothetical protein